MKLIRHLLSAYDFVFDVRVGLDIGRDPIDAIKTASTLLRSRR